MHPVATTQHNTNDECTNTLYHGIIVRHYKSNRKQTLVGWIVSQAVRQAVIQEVSLVGLVFLHYCRVHDFFHYSRT